MKKGIAALFESLKEEERGQIKGVTLLRKLSPHMPDFQKCL
jgi:hypothetical protein